MTSLLAALLCMGTISGRQVQRVSSITGNVEAIPDFESKMLGNKRAVHVYLPPGYVGSKETYPVLYMADGQNVFDGATSFIPNQEWRADETAEAMIRGGLLRPIIIVAVDNAGVARADEYLPTRYKPKGFDQPIGGKADLYGRFMVEELMPAIADIYRVKPGPENTGLCGSSLGGVLALHLGMTYPNVFGKLAVVSPSFWWDSHLMLRRVKDLPGKKALKIWLDIGTKESSDAVQDTTDVRDALMAKGWELGTDLAYFEDKGAKHNEVAWARRFPMMLSFLFGR